MTPEQAASVRRALTRHADGDQQLRERLRAAVAYAKDGAARLTAQGVVPAWSGALLATVSLRAHLGLDPDQSRQIVAYFELIVDRAVAELEPQMDEQAQEIVYTISWMLDRQEPMARIKAAAFAIPGPLAPWQIDLIIWRESAFWVRLREDLLIREAQLA